LGDDLPSLIKTPSAFETLALEETASHRPLALIALHSYRLPSPLQGSKSPLKFSGLIKI
jgi:hypothetical protein